MPQDEDKDLKDDKKSEGDSASEQNDKGDAAKLQDQIKNLEKATHSSREEAKSAKAEAEQLKTQLAELQGKVDKKSDKTEDLIELHPDDVKKLQAWAKQQGLVTKEELEAEQKRLQLDTQKGMAQQAIDEFLAKHKKYDDEAEWAKVQKEFQLYKTPTSLTQYRQILNRIHRDLSGEDEDDAEARAKAKQSNNSRLKLGGGSQASSPTEQAVEDLQKKYPNLSREQIEARIADLNALHKK